MQIAEKEVLGKPLQKRDERNDGTFFRGVDAAFFAKCVHFGKRQFILLAFFSFSWLRI